MPRLVLPNLKYKKSFLADFLNKPGQPIVDWTSWGKYQSKKSVAKDFGGFVKLLKSQTKGQNLPKDYIAQTVFWLVDGKLFLGILVIRHKLTPHLRKIGGHIGYEVAKKFQGKGHGNLILKLGLKKAKAMGLGRALLTCDQTNVKSKSVILANGGKYEGKAKQPNGMPYKLRFWIKT